MTRPCCDFAVMCDAVFNVSPADLRATPEMSPPRLAGPMVCIPPDASDLPASGVRIDEAWRDRRNWRGWLRVSPSEKRVIPGPPLVRDRGIDRSWPAKSSCPRPEAQPLALALPFDDRCFSRPHDRTPRDRCASDSPAPATNPWDPGTGERSDRTPPIEHLAGWADRIAQSGPSEQRFYMMKTRLSVRKCLHSRPDDTSSGFLRISVVRRREKRGRRGQ